MISVPVRLALFGSRSPFALLAGSVLAVCALLLAPARGVAASASRPSPAAARPNVIVVLTDDQGLGDFSCMGNPVLRTPQLDRLREQCVRFTDFHVAPMCTPTRGQLLTGVDAVRNGATSVTGGRSFLRPGVPTLPEMLAAAGYRTGLFGKWHLGDNYPHRPMDRGFQEAKYHLGWGLTSAPEYSNTHSDGRYLHNGTPERFRGYCTDFWFDSAMAWMQERAAAREPFFCYLPTNIPHAPHVVPERYQAPYGARPAVARFFGMIANLDENIGRLEDFLRTTGLRENTVLVFLTDNGGTAGVRVWNAGLRDGKTSYYDGGHRVPCWVRWPEGGLGEPRDVPVLTQVQDLAPTLLELCGITPPSTAHFDGRSLAPLLRGRGEPWPDRTFVVQYSRATLEKWQCAVLSNQWRLVQGKELYAVDTDRAQQHDLAAHHPEIVARLRAHYERWWAELEPLSREFVSIDLGAAAQPVTALTSSDWQDVYADNAGHVRNAVGGPRGGHWNVQVRRAGDYAVELRRWPPDLDLALTSPEGAASRALPIAAARLAVAGQEVSAPAPAGAKAVSFRVTLPAGRTRLQAWFQDAAGQDLCGAYYATVTALEPAAR